MSNLRQGRSSPSANKKTIDSAKRRNSGNGHSILGSDANVVTSQITPFADKTKRPAKTGRMILDKRDLRSCGLLIAEHLPVADVDDAVSVLGDIVLVGDEDDVVALLVQRRTAP